MLKAENASKKDVSQKEHDEKEHSERDLEEQFKIKTKNVIKKRGRCLGYRIEMWLKFQKKKVLRKHCIIS